MYLITSLLCFSLQAQNDESSFQSIFGNDFTSWNVFVVGTDEIFTDSLIVKKEVVVNEQIYKAVSIYNNFSCDSSSLFLRESADRSKVYRLVNDNHNTEEVLCMDLNLEPGEYFVATQLSDVGNDTLYVDSVFYLDGRKHIRFDKTVDSDERKFEFIEGVGTNYGFFLLPFQGVELRNLLCHYKDNVLHYSNTHPLYEGRCHIPYQVVKLNIIENHSELNVFPNPAKDVIYVNAKNSHSNQPTNVCLFNIHGEKVKDIQATLPLSIDTDDLPDGIYLLGIFNNIISKSSLYKIILVR